MASAGWGYLPGQWRLANVAYPHFLREGRVNDGGVGPVGGPSQSRVSQASLDGTPTGTSRNAGPGRGMVQRFLRRLISSSASLSPPKKSALSATRRWCDLPRKSLVARFIDWYAMAMLSLSAA